MTGSGLRDARGLRCRFGDAAATRARADGDSSLECFTPASSTLGAVRLRVLDADGAASIDALTFSFAPAVSLEGLAPTRGPACL